mmetsp:Transcript_49530/g.94638  ORF Transcript_49530/g.94638 Transcript_49530/m.94638 type:complete len:316 (+) Transcript_49530:387-1334(+)
MQDEGLMPALIDSTTQRSASKRRKRESSPDLDTEPEASCGICMGTQTTPKESKHDALNDELAQGVPSDTLVGLQVLKSQFPKLDKVEVVPLMLRSQLYSIVRDRTEVDRQLDQLRCRRVVRFFQLPTAADDCAVVFTQDYDAQVDSLKARATKQGAPSSHVAVFDWFRNKLLPACPEVSITQGELEGHMALAEQRRFDQPPVDAHVPWDKQVSLLVRAGLLARQISSGTTGAGESFWFSIPNVGFISKCLMKGRAELQNLLTRRRYQEILEKELEKRKMTASALGIRFHVRDLVGSLKIERVSTTCGNVLRLCTN